jgi:integrase
VPTIRFHDLRHTSATLLLAEGVHGKIVEERLGHANIAMTLDLYSHVTPDMQRQAADAIDAAIDAATTDTAAELTG